MPRPKDRAGLVWGCLLVALAAVFYASGTGGDVRAVLAILGGVRIAMAFLVSWRLGGGQKGPGTLRPAPDPDDPQ